MKILELTLQRKTDSGYPVAASLTRPSGFLPLRREGTLTLDIAALVELQYDPLAYGTVLGQALFVDEIRDTFVKALGDEPLRVLLSIEAPDLRALDWHRLAAPIDGRWRFLASQQNTPFSLSIPSPASAHFPAIGRRDLRALLLVAGPEALSGDYKLAPFNVAATIASIKTALGDIPCDILDNPTLNALCDKLTATPYTLLHIICHGVVNQSGETILFFPKDSKGTPTPATDLINRLGSLARLPHFAFVSACESALPQNGLGSLAGRLVRELGLPAVLAMTDRVSIATAGAIAAPFYAHLYQHGQPDLALAQSLAGLQGVHDLTVPAIFSRLGDRPLFDDNAERALTEKELEFGLAKLAEALPEHAPVMDSLRDSLTRRLRSTLGADSKSLSESSRAERKETLDQLNSLSLEALDLSFNALCLGQNPPAYDTRSPFRGLESFRPEDAAYFFGRETLTKKLVQKLNEHNFLAVLGASGSGKSSLVMAGLIPALDVPYAVFRPGAEPLAELNAALQAGPQLLVVDQFEELFTLSAREQRPEFISRLLEQVQRIRVVITLRADFLGEVAPFKSLKDEVQTHQEIIPPMDEAELRRAMEGQAGCAGLRFESDLSQQMLDDVSGEPGAMPLLQHALWTLWTRRRGRWLRAEEYRAFGGVKQAIASTAEAVFARCNDFEKERLRDIFLRLTRLDEGTDGRDTRRRVLLRDLIPADSDPAATTLLIKQLADARLLVVTGDEVEVAHEALIRHWDRLRAWLNDDRDNLRLREGVSDDARRWEDAARDESLLNHRGPRLALVLAMSKNPRYRLNPVEQAYLDGCVALREREKTAAAKRRRYAIAGISAALVVMIAILAGWGITNKQQVDIAQTAQAKAEQQSNIALARELAILAQSILDKKDLNQPTAVLLAILSMHQYPSATAGLVLQENTLAYPANFQIPRGENAISAAFSPDGKYIVSGNADGSAKVWDISTKQKISQYIHSGMVSEVKFSPNGKYIASIGGSKICVWDAVSEQKIICVNHESTVLLFAFSPDGHYIASGDFIGVTKVWKTTNGQEIARIQHADSITSVAFSPDSKYLVSGSYDNTARIWSIASGQEVSSMINDGYVYSVAFSSDGMFIATGDDEGVVNVWNVVTGKKISSKRFDLPVRIVAFSPSGTYVAAGSEDSFVQVWDILNEADVIYLHHEGEVTSMAFSPDGNYIATGSSDTTARVWDVKSGQEISRMMHGDTVTFVEFSTNGQNVISGSKDMTIRVWETKRKTYFSSKIYENPLDRVDLSPDGKYIMASDDKGNGFWGPVLTVLSEQKIIRTINPGDNQLVFCFRPIFSPDGKKVASCSEDTTNHSTTINVWDVATGQEELHKTYENLLMRTIAFSPDSRYLVSASGYETIVWDITSGNEVTRISDKSDLALDAVFSQDGQYIISQGLESARVWDISTSKEISRIVSGFNSLPKIVISPDGHNVIFGSVGGRIKVLDIFNGHEIANFTHDGEVTSILCNPDGKYILFTHNANTGVRACLWEISSDREIACVNTEINSTSFSLDGNYVALGGSDGIVRVLDMTNGQIIVHMAHDDRVGPIAISPDNHYIVSGSNGITRVWDIHTGQEIFRTIIGAPSEYVAFSPDSHYIFSWGFDNWSRYIAQTWLWNPKDLISDACLRVTRNLTRAEWAQYIGDALPYQAVCPNLPIEPEPTPIP